MKPKTTHNKLAMAWLLGGLLTVALPGGGLRPGGRNAGVTRGHGVSQPRSADGHPLANPIANPATFANPRTDGHPHPCAVADGNGPPEATATPTEVQRVEVNIQATSLQIPERSEAQVAANQQIDALETCLEDQPEDAPQVFVVGGSVDNQLVERISRTRLRRVPWPSQPSWLAPAGRRTGSRAVRDSQKPGTYLS